MAAMYALAANIIMHIVVPLNSQLMLWVTSIDVLPFKNQALRKHCTHASIVLKHSKYLNAINWILENLDSSPREHILTAV